MLLDAVLSVALLTVSLLTVSTPEEVLAVDSRLDLDEDLLLEEATCWSTCSSPASWSSPN